MSLWRFETSNYKKLKLDQVVFVQGIFVTKKESSDYLSGALVFEYYVYDANGLISLDLRLEDPLNQGRQIRSGNIRETKESITLDFTEF